MQEGRKAFGLSHPYVAHAEPHDDHTITLTFANGEVRRFDMRPYLDSQVFSPLRDLDLFRCVEVRHGSLEWPGERDLAYDMLYVVSTPVGEATES